MAPMTQQVNVLAPVPKLSSYNGHFYTYHKTLGTVFQELGWNQKVALPRAHALQSTPESWEAVLDTRNRTYFPRFLSRWQTRHMYRQSFGAFVHRHVEKNAHNIIFMEYCTESQLRDLTYLLKKRTIPNIMVWCLFHSAPHLMREQGNLFKRIIDRLKLQLGEKKISLFAHTDPIAERWSTLVKHPVTICPAPFGVRTLPQWTNTPSNDLLCCWFPRPALSISQEMICQLLDSTSPAARSIHLIYAEPSNLPAAVIDNKKSDVHLTTLNVPPTPSIHLECIARADLVVMPYFATNYEHCISGTFIECIAAGKIPLVKSGTWMASELERFGLDKLVTDWKYDDVALFLKQVFSDPDIKKKMTVMQAEYRAFHNPSSCAQVFLEQFQQSVH